MVRGSLIILEGCDKSGKSTQCKKLVEYLNGQNKNAELWRFPERSTEIGKVIDSYISNKCELDDHAVHLLFSANRWEMVDSMTKKLNSGITLIVDRYAFSGVAFTSAKGLDLEWCKTCDKGLPTPDAIFYMDITIDEASSRGDFGGERYEVSDFQKKVQLKFQQLKDSTWKMIDARDTIENIHSTLCAQVVDVMKACEEKPLLHNLWMESISTNGH